MVLIPPEQLKPCVTVNRDVSLKQAIASMENVNYGVVIDADEPIALVTLEILQANAATDDISLEKVIRQVPPTIVMGQQREIGDLIDSSVINLLDLDIEGVIVTHDQGIAGILPINIVDHYNATFSLGQYLGPSGQLGDTTLYGPLQTPAGVIICAQCGYPNKVPDYDPDYPDSCQNPNADPHDLLVNE